MNKAIDFSLYPESSIYLPDNIDSIIKSKGYISSSSYSIKLNKNGYGRLYGIDIGKLWQYRIVVVAEPDVRNILISVSGLNVAGQNHVLGSRKDIEITKDININDIHIAGNSVDENNKTCEISIKAKDLPGNRDFYNAKVYVFLKSAL